MIGWMQQRSSTIWNSLNTVETTLDICYPNWKVQLLPNSVKCTKKVMIVYDIHVIEAYRNKTNVRLPQMSTYSHSQLHSRPTPTSTTPSSSTYLSISTSRQSPYSDFKPRQPCQPCQPCQPRQPVDPKSLYHPPFYSTAKPSFSSMQPPVRADMTSMYYAQQNNKNYPYPFQPSLNHYQHQHISQNPTFRNPPVVHHSTVGNRLTSNDQFKKQTENSSEVIAERKSYPRPM